MTLHRDLKNIIRLRQNKTGESYTAARAHVMRDRASLLGLSVDEGTEPAASQRVEAVVLEVEQRSARLRILDDNEEVTFRSGRALALVPGQLVSVAFDRRWMWLGNSCASGVIENTHIDVAKLALQPLALEGGDLETVADYSDPCDDDEPYAPLWKRFATRPRPSFEFDGVAWGAFPGMDPDENPTCDAADLAEAGDYSGARRLLMETLGTDLRCIDAHAHLGNLAFARSPEKAAAHYEIGMRIGELSLPDGFDGLLKWSRTYNRPFLRCLHGYGLCLWRFGKLAEAQRTFERMLSLNPNDNQGVRVCWYDVRQGRSWAEAQKAEEAAIKRSLRRQKRQYASD